MVRSEFRGDRPLHRYLILEIVTKYKPFTRKKRANILRKNPLPISPLTFYSFSLGFPDKLASHNCIGTKDDLVGNKTRDKKERQRIKREQEKDRNRFANKQKKVQIVA